MSSEFVSFGEATPSEYVLQQYWGRNAEGGLDNMRRVFDFFGLPNFPLERHLLDRRVLDVGSGLERLGFDIAYCTFGSEKPGLYVAVNPALKDEATRQEVAQSLQEKITKHAPHLTKRFRRRAVASVGEKLPFVDNCFEVVLCNDSIPWLPLDRAVAKEGAKPEHAEVVAHAEMVENTFLNIGRITAPDGIIMVWTIAIPESCQAVARGLRAHGCQIAVSGTRVKDKTVYMLVAQKSPQFNPELLRDLGLL